MTPTTITQHEACVYWIHLKVHSLPESQGYVGVTTKTALVRFKEHYTTYLTIKKSKAPRLPLHKCFERYGMSGVELKVLFQGTQEECYEYERKLRPIENIGWNMARGGK